MQIISTETAFNCPIFKVEARKVRLADGSEETYWVVVKVPNVEVVALDHDQNLVFISVTRGRDQIEELELPGGKVFAYQPTPEELESQAAAELLEETGFKAARVEFMYSEAQNSDWLERSFHYFIAWDLQANPQSLEPGEKIRIILMTLGEVRQKLENKEFAPYLAKVITAALTKFQDKGLI